MLDVGLPPLLKAFQITLSKAFSPVLLTRHLLALCSMLSLSSLGSRSSDAGLVSLLFDRLFPLFGLGSDVVWFLAAWPPALIVRIRSVVRQLRSCSLLRVRPGPLLPRRARLASDCSVPPASSWRSCAFVRDGSPTGACSGARAARYVGRSLTPSRVPADACRSATCGG